MRRDASINILDKQKYILYAYAELEDTYHVMIAPVEMYDDLKEVVQRLPGILTFSERIIPKEDKALIPKALEKVHQLAGVRSHRAFTRQALSVHVAEYKGIVTFTPTERCKRGGFGYVPAEKPTAPLHDTEALLEALKKAIASCRVEGETVKKKKKSP